MLKQLLLLNYSIYSFHISPTNTNAVNMGILSLENLIWFNSHWSVSCHSCQCTSHECIPTAEIKLNSLISPCTCHLDILGIQMQLHSFFTLSGHFIPVENASATHQVGDWVSPTAKPNNDWEMSRTVKHTQNSTSATKSPPDKVI